MGHLVERLILVCVLGVILTPNKGLCDPTDPSKSQDSIEQADPDLSREVRSNDREGTKFLESLKKLLKKVSHSENSEDATTLLRKSCLDVVPRHTSQLYNILREHHNEINQQIPSKYTCSSKLELPEEIAVLATFLGAVPKLPKLTVEDCEQECTSETLSTLLHALAEKLKLLSQDAVKILTKLQCKTIIANTTPAPTTTTTTAATTTSTTITTMATTTTEKPTEPVTTATRVVEVPKYGDPEYEMKRYEYLIAGGHTERFVELYNSTGVELQPLLADIFLRLHGHFKNHDADQYAEDLYELIQQYYELYGKTYKTTYPSFIKSFEDSFMNRFLNHSSSNFEDKQKSFFHSFAQIYDAPTYSWSYPLYKKYKPKYNLLYLLDKLSVAQFDPYCVKSALDAMGDQRKYLHYNNSLDVKEHGLNIFLRLYIPCYKDVLEHLKPDSKFIWLKTHIDEAPPDFLQLYFRSLLMAGGTSYTTPASERFWKYLKKIYDKLRANNLNNTETAPDVTISALDYYNDYTLNGNLENLDKTVDNVIDVHKEVNDLVQNGQPEHEYLRKDSSDYYQNYYYPRLFWHVLKSPILDYERKANEKVKYEEKRHILRRAYGQYLQFFELFNFEVEQMLKGYRKGSSAYKTMSDVISQIAYMYGIEAFYRGDLVVPLFKEVFKYFNEKMHKSETFKEIFGETFKTVFPDLQKIPIKGLHVGLINDFTSRFRYNYERRVGGLVESPLLKIYQYLQPKVSYDSFSELYDRVKDRYKDHFHDHVFKTAYQDFARSGRDDTTNDDFFTKFYDKAYGEENNDWHGIEYYELLNSIADQRLRSVFERIMRELAREYQNAVRILGIVKFLPTDLANFVRIFVDLYKRYGLAGIGTYTDEIYKIVGVLYYVITQKNPDGSVVEYTKVEQCHKKHLNWPFYVYGRIDGNNAYEVCKKPNRYRRITNPWLLRTLDSIRPTS